MSEPDWGWLAAKDCTESQKANALEVLFGDTPYTLHKIPRAIMTQEQKDMLDDEPTGFLCAPWPMKEPMQ